MTVRAVLLGTLGALVMAVWGQYVNKYVPGVQGVVRGHLPVSVFGLFIVFVLLINPLLGLVRDGLRRFESGIARALAGVFDWLRLRASEIALIIAMVLVACGITDAGLMRHFPRMLVHPVIAERTQPGWQKAKLIEATPPQLLADEGKYSPEVVDNYVMAMGEKHKPIPWSAVPWDAWRGPLLLWSSLIAVVLVGVISLGVLVHRQWAVRERLRYPIVELASSVLKQDERGIPLLVRNRVFWIGLAIVLVIRISNGLHAWFPRSIEIPLQFDFSALKTQFPQFFRTTGADHLATVRLFPACIGFSFLLASEIGLSLGIANILRVIVLYTMLQLGVTMSGGVITGNILAWQNFGAFLAMGLMLMYLGRRYYWQTCKQAVTFVPQAETDSGGVWAFRTLLVCAAVSVALMTRMGLDWPLALLSFVLIMLTYLVLARTNVEAGTFFFAPAWYFPGVVVGLFGLATLGPSIVIVLGLMMFAFVVDPFECLMPYVSNGLKISSDTGLRAGKVGAVMAVLLLLLLAVTIPTAVWADYNNPAQLRRGWDPTSIYNAAEAASTQLTLSGELETVRNYTTMDRLRSLRPDRRFLTAAGVGFGLLILMSVLRLRFSWWPLHPVLILALGSSALGKFCTSFFLGWCLKAGITRFGGAARYSSAKPFVLGIIVGDLVGGFLIMATNWVYYAVTGLRGQTWLTW